MSIIVRMLDDEGEPIVGSDSVVDIATAQRLVNAGNAVVVGGDNADIVASGLPMHGEEG